MKPLEVACPACYSPPGEPCTRPTSTGQTMVKWYHRAREDECYPNPDPMVQSPQRFLDDLAMYRRPGERPRS